MPYFRERRPTLLGRFSTARSQRTARHHRNVSANVAWRIQLLIEPLDANPEVRAASLPTQDACGPGRSPRASEGYVMRIRGIVGNQNWVTSGQGADHGAEPSFGHIARENFRRGL